MAAMNSVSTSFLEDEETAAAELVGLAFGGIFPGGVSVDPSKMELGEPLDDESYMYSRLRWPVTPWFSRIAAAQEEGGGGERKLATRSTNDNNENVKHLLSTKTRTVSNLGVVWVLKPPRQKAPCTTDEDAPKFSS